MRLLMSHISLSASNPALEDGTSSSNRIISSSPNLSLQWFWLINIMGWVKLYKLKLKPEDKDISNLEQDNEISRIYYSKVQNSCLIPSPLNMQGIHWSTLIWSHQPERKKARTRSYEWVSTELLLLCAWDEKKELTVFTVLPKN